MGGGWGGGGGNGAEIGIEFDLKLQMLSFQHLNRVGLKSLHAKKNFQLTPSIDYI